MQGGKGSKKKAEEAARKAEEERLAAQLEEERLERERLEREEEEKVRMCAVPACSPCLRVCAPGSSWNQKIRRSCLLMVSLLALQRLAEEKRQWLEIETKRMEEEKDEHIPLLGRRSKTLLAEEVKQQET